VKGKKKTTKVNQEKTSPSRIEKEEIQPT